MSQWISWRFRFPSILVLLIVGILFGPVFNVLNIDHLLGPLLYPFVSICVSIIMFEGGLSLRVADLRHIGKALWNLITVGVLLTWVAISLLAYYTLGFDVRLSLLLGSILVVTGPTVILPLLRQIRLTRFLASVIRWEGIIIDPVGAVFAVLVFEVAYIVGAGEAFGTVMWILFKTIIFGGLFGVWGALIMMVFIDRYWVPDFLQEIFTLMMVVAIFTLSHLIQSESGLLSVTVMGITLANQKRVLIKHIITFKENLTILLLSSLFIVLAAKLKLESLAQYFNWQMGLFLLGIVLTRFVVVMVATFRTKLHLKERLFLSWMAPRGIVAAAIASLFALRLDALEFEHQGLVSVTFIVIIFTVALYGLTSGFMARFLRVKEVSHQGILLIGAHAWARALAKALALEGVLVMLVDTNRENVIAARTEDLHVIQGSIFSRMVQEEIDLGSIGRLFALTSSDEINLLASIEYSPILGKPYIYRLCPDSRNVKDMMFLSDSRKGFHLFGEGATYPTIQARFTAGGEIQCYDVLGDSTFDQFKEACPKGIPLFIVTPHKKIFPVTQEKEVNFSDGSKLYYLSEPVRAT